MQPGAGALAYRMRSTQRPVHQRQTGLNRGSRVVVVQAFQGTKSVHLSWKLPYRCNFGQSLGVVGSSDSLGNWDPKHRVAMNWSDGDIWKAETNVVSGSKLSVEYKFIVVNSDGSVHCWKPGSNYSLDVTLMDGEKVVSRVDVSDTWDMSRRDVDIHDHVPSTSGQSSVSSPEQQQHYWQGSSVQTSAAQQASQSGSGSPSSSHPVLSERDLMRQQVANALTELREALESTSQSLQDPADLAVLIEDRRMAAVANKVVAYSKALRAAEALSRLPERAGGCDGHDSAADAESGDAGGW